jgi:tetratricopeptide (TPR) repeat protein
MSVWVAAPQLLRRADGVAMKSPLPPLVLGCLVLASPVAAQEIPGSYARPDSKGIRAALAKSPDNIGLQLRLAMALTHEGQKDVSIKIEEIESTIKKVLASDPEALVPLRWIVKDAYYSRKYDEAIQHGQKILKLDPTDLDVATLVVKAMIRVGREADAAASMLEWFRTGNMPPAGATQGILSAVMLNQKVKQSLDSGFPKLVESNPKQVFARLAFAAFLAEAGKGDDAWREFHEAEKGGLCDAMSGGRHPLALMLEKKFGEEPAFPGAVKGNDMADLVKSSEEHPDHVGLKIRVARKTELPVTGRPRKDGEEKVTTKEDLGTLEQAVGMYLKAYETNPECWPPLYRAGELEIERGQFARAAEVLEKAAAKFPEILPTFLALAEARFRAGDGPGAAQDYLKYAREIEPGKKTRAFFEDLAKGNPKVLAPFGEALAKDCVAHPKNYRIRSHLAMLRLIQGDRAGAQQAALESERLGLAGIRGWPNAAIVDAFNVEVGESREATK